MQRGHHIRPDAAAGVSPKSPRNRLDFGVAGFDGKVVQGPKESLLRSPARIEPMFRASRGKISFFIQDVVRGTEQSAVPLFCQGLPVEVISRGGTLFRSRGPGAVLMHNDAPQLRRAGRNPEGVSDGGLQFVRGGRPRIIHRQVLPRPAHCFRTTQDSHGD